MYDKSKPKDWGKLALKAGISDQAAAEAYYNQLTSTTRPSKRWTDAEIQVIDNAIREGNTKYVHELLPDRSLKSIRSKILERKFKYEN